MGETKTRNPKSGKDISVRNGEVYSSWRTGPPPSHFPQRPMPNWMSEGLKTVTLGGVDVTPSADPNIVNLDLEDLHYLQQQGMFGDGSYLRVVNPDYDRWKQTYQDTPYLGGYETVPPREEILPGMYQGQRRADRMGRWDDELRSILGLGRVTPRGSPAYHYGDGQAYRYYFPHRQDFAGQLDQRFSPETRTLSNAIQRRLQQDGPDKYRQFLLDQGLSGMQPDQRKIVAQFLNQRNALMDPRAQLTPEQEHLYRQAYGILTRLLAPPPPQPGLLDPFVRLMQQPSGTGGTMRNVRR